MRLERRPLLLALALGAASGALETGLQVSPRLGLGPAEIALWYALALGLGGLVGLGLGLGAAALGRWRWGLPLAGLAALHGAVAWREHLINAFPSDPKVWGPLLGIGLLGLGLAALLERGLAGRRWPIGAALAGVLLGLGIGLVRARSPAAPANQTKNNIVLITLDTARSDRFSAYGSTNITPAFDRIAREGALFEQAIATAPLTQPSHLAILSGDPPTRSGVVTNGTELGPRPELLPARLQAEGWTTAAFVAGFPLHSRFGWAEPFDVYDDDFGAVAGLHRLAPVRLWDMLTLRSSTLRERRGDRVMARALPWLRAHADRPFFLWIHLFDAHGPYEAPGHPQDAPRDGTPLDLPPYWPARDRAITSADWLIGAYEAEIRYVDSQVGRLYDALGELVLLERTLLVLTADHGESLTEHGLLFDHGDDLFDPSLRVPLAFRGPGVQAGLKIPCQSSNEDVTPTLLGLLGLEDDRERQGRDRSAELRGEPCAEAPVYATTVGARFVDAPPVDHALRVGTHKLIWLAPRDAGAEADYDLYDLVADPGELAPVQDDPPLTPMRVALDAALRGGREASRPEDDAATQEALRALGYVE